MSYRVACFSKGFDCDGTLVRVIGGDLPSADTNVFLKGITGGLLLVFVIDPSLLLVVGAFWNLNTFCITLGAI